MSVLRILYLKMKNRKFEILEKPANEQGTCRPSTKIV